MALNLLHNLNNIVRFCFCFQEVIDHTKSLIQWINAAALLLTLAQHFNIYSMFEDRVAVCYY